MRGEIKLPSIPISLQGWGFPSRGALSAKKSCRLCWPSAPTACPSPREVLTHCPLSTCHANPTPPLPPSPSLLSCPTTGHPYAPTSHSPSFHSFTSSFILPFARPRPLPPHSLIGIQSLFSSSMGDEWVQIGVASPSLNVTWMTLTCLRSERGTTRLTTSSSGCAPSSESSACWASRRITSVLLNPPFAPPSLNCPLLFLPQPSLHAISHYNTVNSTTSYFLTSSLLTPPFHHRQHSFDTRFPILNSRSTCPCSLLNPLCFALPHLAPPQGSLLQEKLFSLLLPRPPFFCLVSWFSRPPSTPHPSSCSPLPSPLATRLSLFSL